jgi:hypothetical protein
VIRIRLTKKLAAVLNGIDVSGLSVGDVLELPDSAARMMIAERWAEHAELSTESITPALLQNAALQLN